MSVIVTMGSDVPGRQITAIVGVVRGSIVRARFVGRDIVASLRNVLGGEVVEYTKLLDESRDQAFARMVEDAERRGADAVIGFRFATAAVMEGSAEVLAYGTGVTLK